MAESGQTCPTLHSKWCLITGGGRGIGRAIAQKFATLGASLVLAARSAEQLEETRQKCLELGAENVKVYTVDLSDVTKVEELSTRVLEEVGAIDILVNNAGTNTMANALDGDPAEMASVIAVNLVAPMWLTRRFAPAMVEKGEGAIINIVSCLAYEPHHFAGTYVASKFGLRGWSTSCHEQLREKGVKVMSVSFGFAKTDIVTELPGANIENMIEVEDVPNAIVPLLLHLSPNATPTEIIIRNSKRIFSGPPPISSV